MLQLMVIYFGPFYILGVQISQLQNMAVAIGFVLNYAAYFAENSIAGNRVYAARTV